LRTSCVERAIYVWYRYRCGINSLQAVGKTFAGLLVSLVVVQVCAYVFTTHLHYFGLIFDDVYLMSDITGYSQ